jgi:Tat protein translocase TatB subunit
VEDDAMFGIGAQELVVIAVIALIVFGPERLPELAARLATAIRDFRRLSDELTGELQRSMASDATTTDEAPAAGAAAAPATPGAVGSATAQSLRVETIPAEPSLPTTPVAMGGAAGAATEATPPVARTAVASALPVVGAPAVAHAPTDQRDRSATPGVPSGDRLRAPATAAATTSEAVVVGTTEADGSPVADIPTPAGSPVPTPRRYEPVDPQAARAAAVFRERRRNATYRCARRA